ncbi:MAG: LysR family transcriptional regulator [Parasporobacterium sp.]|nr:LysR family transcriptional regulator [Parasporobacterium sp.]
MTYLQIKYFIEVARCGNFTSAAERLFMTTPGLSKCINNFEEEIGVRLFERKSRGVEMTPEGRIFYNSICEPFQNLNMVYNHTLSRIRDKRSTYMLVVGYGENLPPRILNSVREFNDRYADTARCIIRTQPINSIFSGLLDGSYEMAIVNEVYIESMSDIEYCPLHFADMKVAVRNDHPAVKIKEMKIEMLKNECFIITVPGDDFEFAEPVFKLMSLASSVVKVHNLQDALLNVAAGNGVAFVPHTVIPISHPDVTFLDMPKRQNESRYCLAWKNNVKDRHVLELISDIKKNF